jgi:hypothetical protein
MEVLPMEFTDILYRFAVIALFVAFIPFSLWSYLRWQLPDKQKRYLEIMHRCGWSEPPGEPGWLPYSLLVELGGAIDEKDNKKRDKILLEARKNAKRDYILPVTFASLTALLGTILLVFGPYMVDPVFDELKVSIVMSGPFISGNICTAHPEIVDCTTKLRMLQNLQVSVMAFIGAYIWSITYIMRRLNVIDLDVNTYYNVGIRIIMSNFVAIILYLAFEKQILSAVESWIPAIAFITGWFPQRAFRFLKERVFSIFDIRRLEARPLPLEVIQGMQLFHRTRLYEAGIDDAQNLANTNLLELLIRTPFNPRLLIDWISQAKLYLLFREKIFILRDVKIRTIYDFQKVMSDSEARESLIAMLDAISTKGANKKEALNSLTSDELQIAWRVVRDDEDLIWLSSARRCLLGYYEPKST